MSIQPIINHEQKYIFFMIPKNACSSVRQMIRKQIEGKEDIEYSIVKLQNLPHVKWSDLSKYKDYYWFAFLRNPFDRVISCWKDKVLSEQGDEVYKALAGKFKTFPEFVHFVANTDDSKIDWHLKSQSYYIGNYHKDMDFIGQVENFNTGMELVKSAIDCQYSYGHMRQTADFNRDDYFKSGDLSDKILIRYKADFKLIKEYAATSSVYLG